MLTSMQKQADLEGPYVIRHGDLWHVARGAEGRHVCDGSQEVAVAFDSEDGTLLKHGSHSRVQEWADKTRKTFVEGGFPDLAATITVISFPVSPETVDELNACAATTGRVLKLADNLGKLAESCPGLLTRPRYPV